MNTALGSAREEARERHARAAGGVLDLASCMTARMIEAAPALGVGDGRAPCAVILDRDAELAGAVLEHEADDAEPPG